MPNATHSTSSSRAGEQTHLLHEPNENIMIRMRQLKANNNKLQKNIQEYKSARRRTMPVVWCYTILCTLIGISSVWVYLRSDPKTDQRDSSVALSIVAINFTILYCIIALRQVVTSLYYFKLTKSDKLQQDIEQGYCDQYENEDQFSEPAEIDSYDDTSETGSANLSQEIVDEDTEASLIDSEDSSSDGNASDLNDSTSETESERKNRSDSDHNGVQEQSPPNNISNNNSIFSVALNYVAVQIEALKHASDLDDSQLGHNEAMEKKIRDISESVEDLKSLCKHNVNPADATVEHVDLKPGIFDKKAILERKQLEKEMGTPSSSCEYESVRIIRPKNT